MPRTTRRALGGLLSVAASPAAAALLAPDPDAGLRSAVEAARAARDAVDCYNIDPVAPDSTDPGDRLDEALATLNGIVPSTLAGLAEKAEIVTLAIERNAIDVTGSIEDAEWHVQLAHRLCADVLALAGVQRQPDHPARQELRRRYMERAAAARVKQRDRGGAA